MKGIVLAGGSGERLRPVTSVLNKHLLPVYNKPMIYYSLSLVMLAGIRDVVMVVNPGDVCAYKRLLGDGSRLGMSISYRTQEEPLGLSHALLQTCSDAEGSCVMLVLGDNILYGHNLGRLLRKIKEEVVRGGGAYVFGYHVPDPERFGVVEFDDDGRVVSIEEKPAFPKSNFAVIGVYFFDETVFDRARKVRPSERGEYEITSLLDMYRKDGKLNVKLLGRGFAWFDAGTHSSFLEAGTFVEAIERKTGYMIGAVEEVAYRNGWIDENQLRSLAMDYSGTDYGRYLLRLLEERRVVSNGIMVETF